MSIIKAPRAFVSSTCYDLAQIRDNLQQFFKSLGIIPILSEYDSFPINPDVDAVQNCLNNVKENADIFVLVIGTRYGSEVKSGTSVTNLEYLEAKLKGIPRYIFIQKNILEFFRVWKNNPTADFDGLVDSKKLFEFIKKLYDPKEGWVFRFESAQDIENTLRKQLANLFKEALEIRSKVKGEGLSPIISTLSTASSIIAIQKPDYWEYLLFSQIYSEEIEKSSFLRKDIEFNIAFGQNVRLEIIEEYLNWIQTKFNELSKYVDSISTLINKGFAKAVGIPGEPGILKDIVYVAQRLGQVYQNTIEWSIDFSRISIDDKFSTIHNIVSKFSSDIISKMEQLAHSMQHNIPKFISDAELGEEQQILSLTLDISIPNIDDFYREFNRLKRNL